MQSSKMADINLYIDAVKEPDTRTFLLNVCNYFNEKRLERLLDLKELIELYGLCVSYLKRQEEAYSARFVFIINELNAHNYDPVQRFTFFWIFQKYFGLLDLSAIKWGRRIYGDWISSEIDNLLPIVREYSQFKFEKFHLTIEQKPPDEQIKLLTSAQNDFMMVVARFNIRNTDFGSLCQKRIEVLKSVVKQLPQTSGFDTSDAAGTTEVQVGEKKPDDMLKANPISDIITGFAKEHGDLIAEELKNIENGDINFAAKILPYKKSYIRALCRKGVLPFSKPHGTYLFNKTELNQWMQRNGSKHRQELLAIGRNAGRKKKR